MLDFLFFSFLTVISIQVFFYYFIFRNFAYLKSSQNSSKSIPVSVIICAKNEAQNLKQNLPSILNQDYPYFEVILINDSSTDETLKVMSDFAASHRYIKIINIQNPATPSGKKKQALSQGIKASTHDYLLFTDADCLAVSKQWISDMTAHFNENKTIILGYGGYFKNKHSFINKLIRFETLLTAIQYFSYAKIGLPYMGVGRNLAYHKNEFLKTDGFTKHAHLCSGDDDLFINEAANQSNTEICFSKNSITRSSPKKTIKEWLIQKRRHVTTAKHYKLEHQLLLGLFYCSQFLFWTLSTLLLCLNYYCYCVLILIALRYITVLTTLNFSAKKLEESNLVIFTPILELFLILSQFGIFITNLISKPKHWK